MRKKNIDNFRNSDLGRAKPKRHFLSAFVDKNLKQTKRVRSEIGMTVDGTSPATVLRIIFGLIVVHLIVIGGVMLRGDIVKRATGPAVLPSIVPPPAIPAAEVPAAPVAVAQPAPAPAQPAPAPAQPADSSEFITQTPVNMEAVTPAPAQPAAPVEPVAVQPVQAPAPQNVVTDKYLVKSGDTWGRIAAQHNITEAALKGANPELAAHTNLPGGTYLTVPLPADSPQAQALLQEKPPVQETAKFHVVKRGENLGLIARKYKISLNKLYKLNNMTPADARRLQVGHKLKVSE